MNLNFKVFQLILSDEMAKEANTKGFEGTAWGRTYLFLTTFPDEGDAERLIREAIDLNLYTHAWSVNARDLEQLFAVTNYAVQDPEEHIVWKRARTKSGSVGDVIMTDNQAWLCMPFGWYELGLELRRHFEENVTRVLDFGRVQ